MSDVTRILSAMGAGDREAPDQLLSAVYAELRQLAAHRMAGEASGQTLQPTALVHEAWLRLGGGPEAGWANRAHFFGAAAEAMRRILVERARRRRRVRHGGGLARVDLDLIEIGQPDESDQALLVSEALDALAEEDARQAEIVRLRFFGGLRHEEIAEILGVSEKTVKRYWAHARAWLAARIAVDRSRV